MPTCGCRTGTHTARVSHHAARTAPPPFPLPSTFPGFNLPPPPPPGNESHAGQVFTCIGALALADALHLVDRDLFCWW